MNCLVRWKKAAASNKALLFFDTILKGYGQVLICLNPFSGLSLLVAIFYLSRAIGLLTLIGVVSSSLTAFVIRARPLHINSGVYGFNGVVLGIAWLWFFKLSGLSIVILVAFAAISSLLLKAFLDASSRTRTNLPVFSLPALILIWSSFLLLQYCIPHINIMGPDQQIIWHWQAYNRGLALLGDSFSLFIFIKIFYKYILAALIILLGIRFHSRIASLFFLLSSLLTVVLIYLLGGARELTNTEFYLYNTVPCGIALGGTFLVLNRKTFIYTLLGIALVVLTTFIGLRYLPLPVFVAPFNFLTISFIWLVKSNALKRSQGFLAIPMEFISTAEFGLEWYKGERYAEGYWKAIEKST